MIYQIPPSELDRHWPRALELLAPAMRIFGRAEMEALVRQRIADQSALLWMWSDDGGITFTLAVVLESDYDWLSVWLVGGRDGIDSLDDGINVITRYASEHGYRGVRTVTRRGIARLLRRRGWRCTAEQMEVEV